jgi:hypothetical protein
MGIAGYPFRVVSSTASFLDGSWLYNLVALLVAIVGFALTLWQVKKTRRAADAARDSARQTSDGFHGLAALIDFSELKNWAEGIISYLDGLDFASAQLRLLDLRNGLARARHQPGAKKLLNPSGWQEIITMVAEVQMICADNMEREQYLPQLKIAMQMVCEQLNGIASKAAFRVEPRPE